MRRFVIETDVPEVGPYVALEVVEGWVSELLDAPGFLGGSIPEDEAELLYPIAMAAWRARNDGRADLGAAALAESEAD
jgi:hypothetical protein